MCRAPYQNSLFWWQKYINTTGLLYHEDTLTFMSRHWNAKDGFNKGNIWNVGGTVFILWMWKCQNKEWDDCVIWRGECVHLRVIHGVNINNVTIWADISRYSQVSGVSQADLSNTTVIGSSASSFLTYLNLAFVTDIWTTHPYSELDMGIE